jgi:ribonuclease HI
MELRAVMECIRFHKEKLPNLPLTVHSDSQLTINCACKLWKRNANLDMWAEYDELVRGTVINFVKVKAHSGDPYNTMVDDLANDARCGC